MNDIGNQALAQIIKKSREALTAGSTSTLSTSEAIAAALVLDRPDWLKRMGYTLADAIERVGSDWIRLIPAAAKQVQATTTEEAHAEVERLRQAKLAEMRESQSVSNEIDLTATLVTYGDAPGYRDVSLTLDLVPIGAATEQVMRARISVSPKDGESIARHIRDAHLLAWSSGRPIDAAPDEKRPGWLTAQQ